MAVIMGAVVALIISVLIYINQNKQPAGVAGGEVLVPEEELELAEEKLKITYPVDWMVYQDKEITVTGYAAPGALVAVFVNDKQDLVSADGEGSFSLAAVLESGSNIISVYSLDEKDEQFFDRVTVIYSNKSLEETLVSESELLEAAEKNEP